MPKRVSRRSIRSAASSAAWTTAPRSRPGQAVATITGKTRALLSAERVALNFLGRLGGIATLTAAYVAAVKGTKARIVCTRKTTPGLRALEKYAVRAGDGANHRFGLYDAVLVKDNHIAAAGGISPALERVFAGSRHLAKVEVEVDTLAQLEEALRFPIDAVLLDNMDAANSETGGGARRRARADGSLGRRRPRYGSGNR